MLASEVSLGWQVEKSLTVVVRGVMIPREHVPSLHARKRIVEQLESLDVCQNSIRPRPNKFSES